MSTIVQYALAIGVVAHGWVHLVYIAASHGWFGDDADWRWNGHSWILSATFEERTIRYIVTVPFLLVALGFILGAIGYVLSLSWWIPLFGAAAVLSTLLYVTLWDGNTTEPLDQGALGVLINLAIIAWIVLLY